MKTSVWLRGGVVLALVLGLSFLVSWIGSEPESGRGLADISPAGWEVFALVFAYVVIYLVVVAILAVLDRRTASRK